MRQPQARATAWRHMADAWRRWRLRKIRDPQFQRWASSFPLTRRIAAGRARRLFDLCAGFVYSQVLLACVELGVLERLEHSERTLPELAHAFDLSPDACRCLLEAACALDLVDALPDGRYGLGEQGAALLANPGVIAMVRHHPMFYRDLADPVRLLRGAGGPTELGRFWAYARRAPNDDTSDTEVIAYTQLMSASQQLIADDVLDAYPVDRHTCLLDVAGGDGTFLCQAAQRAPHLRLMLFDLPPVAERARVRFARAGLQVRAAATGGDFRSDELPRGADLLTLVRVLHDHDDATVRDLLARARRALAPGGRILIAEPMADVPGAEATGAYLGMYLFAMGRGRPRPQAELIQWLTDAGFQDCRALSTRRPLQVQVLSAAV